MILLHVGRQYKLCNKAGHQNRDSLRISAMLAVILLLLFGGPRFIQASSGYNTVTVVNCTKGDGVGSTKITKDIGVLYLTVKSYNAWDDTMSWPFTAVGQTGVVQNFDPGDSATLNCLQKKFFLDSTSYYECKIEVSKTSFPDSVATLSDGGTYYFTGLTTSAAGSFSTTRPSNCD